MNLARAVEVAESLARLPVSDDAEDLLKQVLGSNAVQTGWSLSLAYPHGAVFVRPVEALHLLSLVTCHAYSDGDLHDTYAWWGLLRYLGFFEHDATGHEHPTLRVSDAGKRVAGAQRRVASEELGIAFGVLIASSHFRDELDPGMPVGIVDVDLMLRGSGHGSASRPDYLLVVGPDEVWPQGMVRSLECKGTSDPAICGGQLAKAVEQLAQPLLGCSLPGLAVSTVTGARQVSCVALELTDTNDEGPQDPGQKPGHFQRDAHAQEASPRLMGALASAAQKASWSMLGHYAGNQAAATRWSPKRGKSMGLADEDWERRQVLDSEYGPAIGITSAFDLGDRQLVVTWALDEQVDDALTTGDQRDVLAAQEAFAAELDGISSRQSAADELEASADSPDAVEQVVSGKTIGSVMPDGSIFSLTLR
jgi:hypothetical protein